MNTEDYLFNVYHQGFKAQMGFYAFLLNETGLPVSPTSYFHVCNAGRAAPVFSGQMFIPEISGSVQAGLKLDGKPVAGDNWFLEFRKAPRGQNFVGRLSLWASGKHH
ncbi:MAG TPA: hypothetical protein DIT99_25395 [Candidatus Latescibacteria bacterium]|nr:hypothetical protein [Candidatus Latescibacterota bacterium]